MKCSNCNKEIADNVKFCKFCGTKVQQEAVTEEPKKSCPHCGKSVPRTANFCLHCGNKLTSNPVNTDISRETGVENNDNYITWHILPGQLALKIDENDIEAYKTIKGVYITPGTKALFFVNGKYVATLDSGRYPFKQLDKESPKQEVTEAPKQEEVVVEETKSTGFFRNLAHHIKDGFNALFGRKKPSTTTTTNIVRSVRTFYTVVLVRGTEFPLVFDYKKVQTSTLPADIGIHILCKVSNLNRFFENMMTDKKIVSIKEMADTISPCIQSTVGRVVANMSYEEISNDQNLTSTLLDSFTESVNSVYDFITLSKIINITSQQEDLQRLRQLKDELYIAEKELEHLQMRHDYMNRLQSVENAQLLNEARTRVDFEALMNQIDNDALLNADNKAQFVEMLEAQAALRRATTETEQQNALDKLTKTRLLSEEEIAILRNEIQHRASLSELSNSHVLAIATLRNQREIDEENLSWEIEIGNKRLENNIARNNMIFENDLRQREQEAQVNDRLRRSDWDFEKDQMAYQMDLLRQAVEIREGRDQAQHNREMQSQQMILDAENEKLRIHSTMTYEQIMASNPDISPEAAAALARKFEAEALAAQNDKTAELMSQHNEDFKNLIAQQMALTKDVIASQTLSNAVALENKQQELNRIHRDTQLSQDRYMEGVRSTVSAVAMMNNNGNNRNDNPPTAKITEEFIYCPDCGKKLPANTMICDGCGTSL